MREWLEGYIVILGICLFILGGMSIGVDGWKFILFRDRGCGDGGYWRLIPPISNECWCELSDGSMMYGGFRCDSCIEWCKPIQEEYRARTTNND